MGGDLLVPPYRRLDQHGGTGIRLRYTDSMNFLAIVVKLGEVLGQVVAEHTSKQCATEELMATTQYEAALHAVEQLTPEEQRQLQDALASLQARNTMPSSRLQPSGAALVAMLEAQPSDPAVWEEIGRIIEDECERIDPSTW